MPPLMLFKMNKIDEAHYGAKGLKVTGWNIFVEVQDENGEYYMEVWDIRDGISSQIDLDFYEEFEKND
tara:strand:+ start:138 stop:341 length:204 start_codon:yes stop_codon:yes gene_type:complete